jgi:hypothetical protein
MLCFLRHKWPAIITGIGALAALILALLESGQTKIILSLLAALSGIVSVCFLLFQKRTFEKTYQDGDWSNGNGRIPELIITPKSHCCGTELIVEMRPEQYPHSVQNGIVTIQRNNNTLDSLYKPLTVLIYPPPRPSHLNTIAVPKDKGEK